jgi:hypothetical protein
MVKVKEIDSGGFGEQALLNAQNKRRVASILCKEDTYLAILPEEIFKSVMEEQEKNKLDKMIKFLHTFDYFKYLKSKVLKSNVIQNLEPYNIKAKQVLYEEGSTKDYIYIMQEG